MNRRQSSFAYAVLLLAGIAIACAWARPTSAQPGTSLGSGMGRHQMVMANNGTTIYVMDTVTGHTWAHGNLRGQEWVDLGIPPVSR